MKIITGISTYYIETCCNCNMEFGMTNEFREKRLADKKTFYCPSGHAQSYVGETEEQKLRKVIIDKNSEINRLNRLIKKTRKENNKLFKEKK